MRIQKRLKNELLLGLIIVTILLISTQCFSQEKPKPWEPAWMKHKPGEELQKASNQFGVGIVFMGIGGALTALNLPRDGRPGEPIFRTGGSIIMLAGSVVCMTSWIHVKRAGIILDKKLTASIGPGTISLRVAL